MPIHFKSSKIVTPNKKKERSAITIVRSILGDEHVDYHLGENDKTADIDGYIAIADSDSCFEAKIEVQIKTLPKKYYDKPAFDCPTTLLGYAEISVVPVILMVGDAKRDIVWCKHLKWCNKQTYFRHFFVKLIRHFAYCFRGSRALVYS